MWELVFARGSANEHTQRDKNRDAQCLAGDHNGLDTILGGVRNSLSLHLLANVNIRLHQMYLITRLHHLVLRGQVHPELQTVRTFAGLEIRHLRVHNSAPGRHPLQVARANGALAVTHRTRGPTTLWPAKSS